MSVLHQSPAATGEPLPVGWLTPLGYPALRMRWCGVALLAFVQRWGVYALIATALFGAGADSSLDSIGAVAAWLVLPLFYAAAQPALFAAVIVAQSALGGVLVWSMRPLLWPARWGPTERALPIPRRELLRSDAVVTALGLLPLCLMCAIGAAVWLQRSPAWLLPWRLRALAGLALVVLGSLAAGVAVLQALRRPGAHRHRWHDATTTAAPWPGAALTARAVVQRRPVWVALWVLPLWRGPSRRSGRALLLGCVALGAVAAGLYRGPAVAGWWLAGFALLCLLVTTRLNTLARAEWSSLIAACATLPLAPDRLARQRAALTLLPCALGLPAAMAALPLARTRASVAAAYTLACALSCAAEVAGLGRDAASKSSRWLFSVAVVLALASEVVA